MDAVARGTTKLARRFPRGVGGGVFVCLFVGWLLVVTVYFEECLFVGCLLLLAVTGYFVIVLSSLLSLL